MLLKMYHLAERTYCIDPHFIIETIKACWHVTKNKKNNIDLMTSSRKNTVNLGGNELRH